jgi:hypothetical protein
MEMGLCDIGLQREREGNDKDDEVPHRTDAPRSPIFRFRCRHQTRNRQYASSLWRTGYESANRRGSPARWVIFVLSD